MTNQHNDIISKMLTDKAVRISTVCQSHYWFFHFYFPHYVVYKTARFQKEFFWLTEKDDLPILAIAAFRGSAKSTILTMSYPLWAILGVQKKKFVLLLSQTQDKAQQHLINIKKELETNDSLKRDLGPFQEETNQWGIQSLVIPKFNAKISTGSLGQSIRGVRHRQYRPDLIIIDDLEDLDSIKTTEGRKKAFDWLTGEVIPAGDQNTKIVVTGNLLREESVLERLKQKITSGKLKGIYREYPIINDEDKPLWPGKFPSQKEIETEKQKAIEKGSWQREYMLNPIEDRDQIIHPDWIHHYDKIESNPDDYRYTVVGVDPAISESDTADFTGIVIAKVYGNGENLKIYILPNPINKKMNSSKIIGTIRQVYLFLSQDSVVRLFIENIGFQRMIAQQLNNEDIPAEEVKIQGDKGTRLRLISNLIKDSKVLFPREGAENLINQVVNFGIEKHDDLVDALTLLVSEVIKDKLVEPRITIFD